MTRLQRAWTRMNPLWMFAAWLFCLWFVAGCASHCRIDQRVPEGATFEDAERLKREECK